MVMCVDTGRRAVAVLPPAGDHAASIRFGQEPDRSRGRQHDGFRFLREWVRNPVATAALAPSGKALTALMTRGIDARSGAVLELGPGTGAFTQGLVARGVVESDLTLVEQNPVFARLLERRYPKATILGIDAAALGHAWQGDGQLFGAAICGLGLRTMDARQVEAIIAAAFMRMNHDASFYFFTYGRRCSVPADILTRLGLFAERVGSTMCNMPPASVYRLAPRPVER